MSIKTRTFAGSLALFLAAGIYSFGNDRLLIPLFGIPNLGFPALSRESLYPIRFALGMGILFGSLPLSALILGRIGKGHFLVTILVTGAITFVIGWGIIHLARSIYQPPKGVQISAESLPAFTVPALTGLLALVSCWSLKLLFAKQLKPFAKEDPTEATSDKRVEVSSHKIEWIIALVFAVPGVLAAGFVAIGWVILGAPATPRDLLFLGGMLLYFPALWFLIRRKEVFLSWPRSLRITTSVIVSVPITVFFIQAAIHLLKLAPFRG